MTGAVGQQFNLRWNNHTNNFLQVFLEQFTCQSMVDVTISCQGQFLKAHKMVLSACSPYFQELFQVHTVHNPVIIMNQMKFNDVKMIIEFMYRGEIKVLEQDIDSLLEVAESLQVKGLCTVRTKYEKGEIQSTNAESTNDEEKQQSEETTPSEEQNTTMTSRRKKRKMSHTVNELANEPIISEATNGIEDKTDDDLPTEIKVEPPDIRDIDEELVADNMDYESRLVIDEPEETRQGPTARILKRKTTRIIKQDTQAVSNKWVAIAPKDPAKVVDPTKYAKIPRPPNAFMIFANEWRRTLASENPRETNKDISVRLGIMWKNLSTELKANYYQQAREADAEHKRKYPGYYYSPKEARLRKNQKDLQMNKRVTKNIDAMRLVKVFMPDSHHNDPPLVLSMAQSENEDNIEIDEEISAVDIGADVDLDEDIDEKPELDSVPSENGDEKTGG